MKTQKQLKKTKNNYAEEIRPRVGSGRNHGCALRISKSRPDENPADEPTQPGPRQNHPYNMKLTTQWATAT